jgi:DNA-binding response OmpR family regulator
MGREEARRQGILLVDVDVLVRHELAEYLRHCGYRVIEASTTDEAMTVLSRATDEVGAVLCDAAAVGGVNGFELATWARQRHPGLPVLLAGSPEKAADAVGDLCDDGPQLIRPYDPSLVIERIRQRLAARERNRQG